jgi:putative ABC transport system ATP-binding protein
MPAIVRVQNLVKNYYLGAVTVNVLKGIDLEIEQGDFVALMGPSGSGKSTLMNILGCLDRPTAGDYFLSGRNVAHLNDDRLSDVRCRDLGFIFQSYNLLPQYTVVENIELPLMYQGIPLNDRTRHRCVALADLVGLGDRQHHRPLELSGGQQQRVAIARALVNDPHVILGDEPTGNLDSRTSGEIMEMLASLNTAGKTIIMVTHEPDIAEWARRVIRLRDGRIESDERNRA